MPSDIIDDLDEPSPIQELGDYAMEFVDRSIDAYGEDISIGEIVIVAEVCFEDENGDPQTQVAVLSSEDRLYVQTAILKKAIENIEAQDAVDVEDGPQDSYGS